MAQRVTKRSIKSANTKQLIIESTRRLMRQYGYEGTSIQMICQEAKISTGTFYHFFASKHDVVEQVMAEVVEALYATAAFDYEADSPYKLAENYSHGAARLVETLSAEACFGVFFFTPNGNKLLFSKEHPSNSYLTNALKGFQQAGKLRADISAEQMFTELFSCNVGAYYSAYTTGNMDAFQERLETLLKRLISAYMVPGTA